LTGYIQSSQMGLVETGNVQKGWKQWKLCNLKIKLNTDQCLSNKIWGNYYTKHSVLQSWREKNSVWHGNWCSVLPMDFVSVPPFFCNIVYNLSIFFFLIHNWMQDYLYLWLLRKCKHPLIVGTSTCKTWNIKTEIYYWAQK
jgi:hypothetical protein